MAGSKVVSGENVTVSSSTRLDPAAGELDLESSLMILIGPLDVRVDMVGRGDSTLRYDTPTLGTLAPKLKAELLVREWGLEVDPGEG